MSNSTSNSAGKSTAGSARPGAATGLSKPIKKEEPASASGIACCYCDGSRELGTLELYCAGCCKWFHGRCLRNLKDFYGLPFMVCYVFHCSNCSPTKAETWIPKQANFPHMCVTALANLTWRRSERKNMDRYFDLESDIIPYFTTNWDYLTSMPRRVKNTWHQTLQKTLAKEVELFAVDPNSDSRFCLTQTLIDIGPNNEVVKAVGRKATAFNPSSNSSGNAEKTEDDGGGQIKTRGFSKRKAVEATTVGKRTKNSSDYTSTKLSGFSNPVDYPFNRDGYRYFLVEMDPNAPNHEYYDDDEISAGKPIPAYLYRMVRPCSVTLSPHDRASQLKLSDDRLTVTGYEGYCVARATHPVFSGRWYFEVEFLQQPPQSHIRIGWSHALAIVHVCVGYNKFSYAWRSRKGTAFHDSMGHHYAEGGFGEGDILGCMIDLGAPETASSSYLPPCHKDRPLIKFKNHYYYEDKDEADEAIKSLRKKPGTSIEFFRNGKGFGKAFSDIYAGGYYPAVSLYRSATVRCNFGPNLRFPLPPAARPISDRAEEIHIEQAMADILYLVEHEAELRDSVPH